MLMSITNLLLTLEAELFSQAYHKQPRSVVNTLGQAEIFSHYNVNLKVSANGLIFFLKKSLSILL
jgi:hypothetical protein